MNILTLNWLIALQEGVAFCENSGMDWHKGGYVRPEDENLNEIDREVKKTAEKEEKNDDPSQAEPSPSRLKRQSTMAATAEVRSSLESSKKKHFHLFIKLTGLRMV